MHEEKGRKIIVIDSAVYQWALRKIPGAQELLELELYGAVLHTAENRRGPRQDEERRVAEQQLSGYFSRLDPQNADGNYRSSGKPLARWRPEPLQPGLCSDPPAGPSTRIRLERLG